MPPNQQILLQVFHNPYKSYHLYLKSATYRVSWEFTCKTTKILLLYIFLGHNRNVVNTKFPYPIKRLEVIRGLTRKAWPLTKVCLEQVGISIVV